MTHVKLPNPKQIRKFAGGGAAEAQPAAQPDDQGQGGGGQDPMQMLTQMVQEYMQSHDPQLADQIIGMLAQLLGLQGGGAADQGQAQPGADQGAGGGAQPMAKNGMKLNTHYFKAGGKVKFKVSGSKGPAKDEKKTAKSAYESYKDSKKKVDSTSTSEKESEGALEKRVPSSFPVNVHLEFNPATNQIEPVHLHVSVNPQQQEEEEQFEVIDSKGKPFVKKRGVLTDDHFRDMVSGLNLGKYKVEK